MQRAPSPRGGASVLTALALIVAAVLIFTPNLIGAWLGGLIGSVWATALGAIIAILSGLFGAVLSLT